MPDFELNDRQRTFIEHPANQPADLDIAEFEMKPEIDNKQPDDLDSLAMMKIVNQVNEKHDQMMGVYQNRINSVNTIKHWWNKQNNANSAINSLNL
jgi:hypothetical protein